LTCRLAAQLPLLLLTCSHPRALPALLSWLPAADQDKLVDLIALALAKK
jgi:hypothetical protein